MSTRAGEIVDGRYQLVSRLGEGSFGEVWRAHDTRLSQRPVAVKLLKAEFVSVPEAVSRFEAEADALAQVRHPNVVAVHDRGRWQGHHFLVTELVEGEALTVWIERQRATGALPPIASALALFEQLCAGMEAAHAVRAPGPIVHRDLKPDNVMLSANPDGTPWVKVLDFGIAQLGGRSGTRTGALMGTPLYMAPEQALGNIAAVGPWTDVFALAVIATEMLTLRAQVDVSAPWWGTAMQRPAELRALLGALRGDVPGELWDVIAAALSQEVARRPRDAAALRAQMQHAMSGASSRGVAPTLMAAPPVVAPTQWAPAPPSSSSTAPLERQRAGASTRAPGRTLVAGGLGVVVMGALAAVPLAMRAPGRESPRIAGSLQPPHSGELIQPSGARASSHITLSSESFPASLAFDHNPSTAWNEGVQGHGRGEWIEATFERPVLLREIEMSTGWNAVSPRGSDLFRGNAHLRRVRVTFSSGRAVEHDIGQEQRTLHLENLDERTTSVRFTALEVWPGSRWQDLALSDIAFRGVAD